MGTLRDAEAPVSAVPVAANGAYAITFSGGSVVTAHGTAIVAGLLNSKIDYLAQVLVGIVSIARSSNNAVVSFNAVQGRSYRLERTLDLAAQNWQSVSGVADQSPGASGVSQFTDPNALVLGKAFYRVRVLP
ncbi:MAG: hypothetical protein M3R10_06150 [Verrucomicrobiota bacterium]|nr:hypothetical protein [Verrucomicrobiota bacterium]